MLELRAGYRVLCHSRSEALELKQRHEDYGISQWQVAGYIGVLFSIDESDIYRVVETDPNVTWHYKSFKHNYES